MKIKLNSIFSLQPSAFGLLAACTLFTTPSPTQAQINWGNALSFLGTDGYVDLGAGGPVLGTHFTQEAWIQQQGFDWTYHGIVGNSPTNGENYRSPCLFVHNGTDLHGGFGTGSDWHPWDAFSVLEMNAWNHVAASYDGSTYRVYVNGQQVYSNYFGDVPCSTPVRYIGQVGGFPSFTGLIDEVRLWNVARTAEEIRQDMGRPLRGSEPNLMAYWRFDEGLNTTARDATTNHFDASLVNSPVWTKSSIPLFLDIHAGLPRVLYGSVACGDYDNDGRLDFLLTGTTNDTLSGCIAQVWRNTGSGFTNVPIPGLPGVFHGTVAWGDYDNDGHLDFLLTGSTASGESIAQVWRNTDTSFTNINAGLPGVHGSSVAWGDYDNDGRLDILLAGQSVSGVIAQVWRNTGNGFNNINAGLPGVYEPSFAWGDYDNDGRLDILLAGFMEDMSKIAQVWRNTGSGFTNVLIPGLPGVSYGSVAWGDYDNDGRLDILLTGRTASNSIAQVWRNTGTGFTNLNAGLPGVYNSSVAWGDYDKDGRLDILLTGATRSTEDLIAQVWRNTGIGFTNLNAGLPGAYNSSVASGDFDNDGRLDILLTGQSVSGEIAQLWRNIGASATIPLFLDTYAGLPGVEDGSVAWGDYDNDGRLDILLTGRTNGSLSGAIAQVWRNTGSGFTNINAGLPAVEDGSVAWGDYDNDGRLDILLTGFTASGIIAQVWRNTGNGFTNINAELPGVYGSSVAWGDYDNDGRLDILLTGTWATIYYREIIAQVWRNTGNGFHPISAGLPGVEDGSVAWGDYDNDGRLDILLAGLTASGETIAQVWRNTGNGFTNINAGLPGVYRSSVAWGDYDNDGKLDILLTGPTNASLSGFIAQVWRNTGNGFINVTATVAPDLPGVYRGSVAWGDYDNNGRLDILLTGVSVTGNSTSAIAQVWRNTGNGFTNVTETVARGLPGVCRGLGLGAWGDYNNDGKLDLLLTGEIASSETIAQVWRNIGSLANTQPAPPVGLAVAMAGSAVNLSWNPASDAETPAPGLTYNLRVGTTPGGSDIVSPQASASGERRLPAFGNAQQSLRLPLTAPYSGRIYWSVQAVDSSFTGSVFSDESSFTLWPMLGPASGLVPGDANGDGIVDATDLGILLTRLSGTVDSSQLAAVVAHHGVVTQSDLDMVLSNYWPASPWLSMTNLAGLGGTNISFGLTNSTAGAFSVLMSTNLADWEYLGPATPRYEFNDTNAPVEPQRYYRLRWP